MGQYYSYQGPGVIRPDYSDAMEGIGALAGSIKEKRNSGEEASSMFEQLKASNLLTPEEEEKFNSGSIGSKRGIYTGKMTQMHQQMKEEEAAREESRKLAMLEKQNALMLGRAKAENDMISARGLAADERESARQAQQNEFTAQMAQERANREEQQTKSDREFEVQMANAKLQAQQLLKGDQSPRVVEVDGKKIILDPSGNVISPSSMLDAQGEPLIKRAPTKSSQAQTDLIDSYWQ